MRINIAVFVAVALASASFVGAATPPDPSAAAWALNAQSQKSLGVSVRALAFLFGATPGSYLDKTSLIKEGSWPRIQELERAGYVTVTTIPSGQGALVSLSLTKTGSAIYQALCLGR